MAILSPASSTALTQLSARSTLPLISQVAIKVAYVCLLWSQRRRTRMALRDLSDHTLRDIGLTPTQAHAEADKWFWRP
ncbi:MAG: DUF1127 domain-containing protein [Roseovarius sp.]